MSFYRFGTGSTCRHLVLTGLPPWPRTVAQPCIGGEPALARQNGQPVWSGNTTFCWPTSQRRESNSLSQWPLALEPALTVPHRRGQPGQRPAGAAVDAIPLGLRLTNPKSVHVS